MKKMEEVYVFEEEEPAVILRVPDQDNFSKKVCSDLLKMLENGSSNDVTIVCQHGEVKANKDILMARSDYFATMLSNENFEMNRIEMKNAKKNIMKEVLRFLFSGKLNTEPYQSNFLKSCALLDVFRLLLLDEAFSYLESYLINFLDGYEKEENKDPKHYWVFVGLLMQSEKYRLESITNKLVSVVCNILEGVSKLCFSKDEKGSWKYRTIAAWNQLTFDTIEKIFNHPVGNFETKTQLFHGWNTRNDHRFKDEEKVSISKVRKRPRLHALRFTF